MSDLNKQLNDAITNISVTSIAFLNNLLDAMRKKTKSIEGQQSIATLQSHLSKGGSLKTISVKMEDQEEMKKLFRAKNICYSVLADSESPECVRFIYRDADENRVAAVCQNYQIAHSMLGEVTLKQFMDSNIDKNIYVISGLSRTELEIFRFHAQKSGLTFAVQACANGAFNIVYNKDDAKQAEAVQKNVAWDLTGPHSEDVVAEVQKQIKDRDLIEDAVYNNVNQAHIIIDAKASRMVEIDREGARVYNLVHKDKEEFVAVGDEFHDKQGNKVLNYEEGLVAVIEPKSSCHRDQLDFRESVFMAINSLNMPTVIKPEDLKCNTAELTAMLIEKNTIYPHGYAAYADGKLDISSVKNLNKDELNYLMVHAKDKNIDIFAAGNDIACSECDRPQLMDMLKTMHIEKSNADEFIRDSFRYNNQLDIAEALKDKEKEIYVVDAGEPENVMCISDSGLLIKDKNGKRKYNRDNYIDKKVDEFYSRMKKPVVLTAEEIKSKDFAKIVKEKNIEAEPVLAEIEMEKKNNKKKELFEYAYNADNKFNLDLDNGINELDLTQEDINIVVSDPHIQAAATKCHNCDIKELEVNKSVLEDYIKESKDTMEHYRRERTETKEYTR